MVFRRHVIADSETLSDAEVWPADLKGLGAISAIEIEVYATNGSSYNEDNHIHDIVKTIEVVDGAKKYHSVTGKQEHILNWASLRKIPIVHMDETKSVTQYGQFLVMFGRYIGDPLYYLDVDKLSNPKLYVDFNIANVRAAGVDAFTSTTGAISVRAIVDQEKVGLAQKGYLRAIEQYKWTTAASGDEKIELPVDYPYRMIALRAYKQNSDPLGGINKVKLAFDAPKYEYMNEYTRSFMQFTHGRLGLPGWVNKWFYRASGASIEWPCSRNSQLAFNIDGNLNRRISISNFWKGYCALSLVDSAEAAVTTRETHEASLLTWMLHNGLIIPFGEPALEGNFFPAQQYKKATLTVTQASINHAASVVLEEVATQ